MTLKKHAFAVFGLAAWLGATPTAEAACDARLANRKPISQYVVGGGNAHDKTSGLTWQRCSVGQSWQEGAGCVGVIEEMAWGEAMQQGGDGWRLPTIDELKTLVSPTCRYPSINEETFPDMEAGKYAYWSSTKSGPSAAWQVSFSEGYPFADEHLRTHKRTVRLVRSGQ